jgi:hypothetical protein
MTAQAQMGLVVFGPVGVAVAIGITGVITISIWQNSPDGQRLLGEITDVVGRGIDGSIEELQRILDRGGNLAKQQARNIEKFITEVFAKNIDDSKPSAKECSRAIKILTEFERLAGKYGIKLGKNRLKQLNEKRDNGTITIYDLPSGLRGEFPGRFVGKTLAEIIKECGG